MRILVTGASGYTGSHVVQECLERGWSVEALVRSSSDVSRLAGFKDKVRIWHYDGTIASLCEVFRDRQIDSVVHIAGRSFYACPPEDVQKTIDANLTFGTQLLEVMNQFDCRRIVVAGSYWQTSMGADYSPNCLYAATKEAFERIIDYYCQNRNFRCISLRLYDIYGPNDPRPKIWKMLDQATVEAQVVKMTPGTQIVSFSFIRDVTAAFCRAVEMVCNEFEDGQVERYYVPGDPIPLKEAVRLYLAQKGHSLEIDWGGVPFSDNQIMDPYVGTVLPGWVAKYSFGEAVKEMCE